MSRRKLPDDVEGQMEQDHNDMHEQPVHDDEVPAKNLEEPAKPASALEQKLKNLFSEVEGLRSEAQNRVFSLEAELADAKSELAKIDQLLGKNITPAPTARLPRQASASTGERGPKSPKGFWNAKILEALESNPDGLLKKELVEALGVTGDAKAMANLSSAIQNMKKQNLLGQSDDKRYTKP